jgi:thiamine-monophosphate kinase
MQLTNEIIENDFIERLTAVLPRSPLQSNKLHESDAELIDLPGGRILAVTIDSIAEEIESGLYSDPYLIGWMLVTVNASDLAAVGAEPLGIMLSQTFSPDASSKFIEELQKGIRDACNAYRLYVMGGDTNFSGSMQMGGCAFGLIADNRPMTRIGCKPGDLLYSSGPLGLGSAYALSRLINKKGLGGAGIQYKPAARVREGLILRDIASCCMDTSDGAIATIDQLTRLNGVGAEIERPISEFMIAKAVEISRQARLPLWTLLAGPHGEFELIFTVSSEKIEILTDAFSNSDFKPLKLGKIDVEPGIRILSGNNMVSLPGAKIRNLWNESRGDAERYIAGLLEINKSISP